MKNIHVLPTDKPSRLYSYKFIDLYLYPTIIDANVSSIYCKNQHIYITSDEEIKEGNWYINTFVSEREQKPQTHTEKKQLINHQKDYRFKFCKKIILTTEQELIKDGVQAIDDEFLEWFVKNPSCEEVEVKPLLSNNGRALFGYKIIIPKEELYERTTQSISLSEVDKQETLEEDNIVFITKEQAVRIFGAKKLKKMTQKQERMYSEKEVENLIYEVCNTVARLQGIVIDGNHINTAYNQSKNK